MVLCGVCIDGSESPLPPSLTIFPSIDGLKAVLLQRLKVNQVEAKRKNNPCLTHLPPVLLDFVPDLHHALYAFVFTDFFLPFLLNGYFQSYF